MLQLRLAGGDPLMATAAGFDFGPFLQALAGAGLESWAQRLPETIAQWLNPERFGDLPRWQAALAALPDHAVSAVTLDRAAVGAVERLKAFVSQARALKAEHNLASRRDVTFFLTAGEAEWVIVADNLAKLTRMMGAAELARREAVEGAPAAVTPLGTLYLDLASTVDAAAEKQRLSKELEKLKQHIAGTQARLGNKAFTDKAPPAVIEGARKQLADQQAKQAELERLLASLG